MWLVGHQATSNLKYFSSLFQRETFRLIMTKFAFRNCQNLKIPIYIVEWKILHDKSINLIYSKPFCRNILLSIL